MGTGGDTGCRDSNGGGGEGQIGTAASGRTSRHGKITVREPNRRAEAHWRSGRHRSGLRTRGRPTLPHPPTHLVGSAALAGAAPWRPPVYRAGLEMAPTPRRGGGG